MEKQQLRVKLLRILEMAQSKLEYDQFLLAEYKNIIKCFETIFLFGAGTDGIMAYDFLLDVIGDKEVYFIDNDSKKHGKELYKGIYCYGREKMYGCDPKSTIVLITTSKCSDDIYRELVGSVPFVLFTEYQSPEKLGRAYVDKEFINRLYNFNLRQYYLVHKDEIIELFDSMQDVESCNILYARLVRLVFLTCIYLRDVMTLPQYFPKEITSRFSTEEVFLDCGAYTGDTIEEFRKQTGDKFKKIYAFELDRDNFIKMENNPKVQDDKIVLINAGVSDKNCIVTYYHDDNKASSSSYALRSSLDYTAHTAELKSIDEMINDSSITERVTFVKMDIEGAELDALHGMREMIKRDKPKLAVCVYHKPKDLIELSRYIKELVPQYRFVLRHHLDFHYETVLYAYIE